MRNFFLKIVSIINLNLTANVNEYQNLQLKLFGIFAKNREEWLLLDFTSIMYGMQIIPFYDALGISFNKHYRQDMTQYPSS